jgi:hypothetical protein
VPLTASTRFLITTNFFRARDTFRQYALDTSALTLAVARPPTMTAPSGNPLTAVLPAGVMVDPRAIYYEGVSWGSIDGVSVVATNPRITRAAFSVGGGTIVDALSTSPTYQPSLDALLPGMIPGFTRAKVTGGNPAFDPAIAGAYLKVLQIAKWILDPSDPINYAQHLIGSPLPNLLADRTGAVAQSPKEIYTQVALGDLSVPNPTNYLLDRLIGGPLTLYTNDVGGPAPHDMIDANVQVALDAALFLVDPVLNPPPATRALVFP